MSTLPLLKTVFIEPRPAGETPHGIALEPSPVSLGRLLMRMPPSIEFYSLGGGVFFVDDVGLPLVSLRRHPWPEVSLELSLKLKGTEKARPVELSRRTNTDGVQLWSIVPEVRFHISLLHRRSSLEADSLGRTCRTSRSAATRRTAPDAVKFVGLSHLLSHPRAPC